MTGRLVGRIAVITGASRGIGAAVTQRFAAEGARVILIGRTLDDLEAVGNLIRANLEDNGVAALVPFDLTVFDKIDQLGCPFHSCEARWCQARDPVPLGLRWHSSFNPYCRAIIVPGQGLVDMPCPT